MSIGVGPDIVDNGLVLHLDAANYNSYNGTLSSWTDLSNENISLSLQDSSSNTVAFTNNYIQFSPVNMTSAAGHYLINDPRISILTKQITLECWFYITTFYANAARPFSPRTIEGGSPIGFSVYSGGVTWEINTSTGWQSSSVPNASCVANTWICVQQTTDDATKLFNTYINGTLVGSLNYTGTPNSGGGILLGKGYFGGNVNFAGRISNAKYYNRTLSAAELFQNFNALRGRYGI